MLCHFENVKKKNSVLNNTNNSLILWHYWPIYLCSGWSFQFFCQFVSDLREYLSCSGDRSAWDRITAELKPQLVTWWGGVCVCVCVCCIENPVLKWKASQSVKLSRWMQPAPVQILTCRFWSPWTSISALGFALLMQSVFSLVWITFANVHPSLQLDENSFNKVWEKQACKDLLSTG